MNPSKYKFLALAILPASLILASPVLGDAVCNDGWYSNSSGSGTCSWHGGVAYWVDDIPTWEPPYIPPWEPPVYLDDTVPPLDLDSAIGNLSGTTIPSTDEVVAPPGFTSWEEYYQWLDTEKETKTQDWWVWAFWGSIILAFGHILILDIIAEIRKWRKRKS